jgi:hypothetical protein
MASMLWTAFVRSAGYITQGSDNEEDRSSHREKEQVLGCTVCIKTRMRG